MPSDNHNRRPDRIIVNGLLVDALIGVHDFERLGRQRVRFDVESDQIGEVMASLSEYGIQTLVTQPPSLEELFLRHYDRADA